MKKILLSSLVGVFSFMNVNAQITVAEPDFAEETLLLTSDDKGVLLNRENGTVKAKAGASLYLTGIGKIKSRLTLKGIHSVNETKGASTTRLIIKGKDNLTDPNSFINIFKFEVTSANSTGKCNRYYCMLSISSLRTCWTATVSKSQ